MKKILIFVLMAGFLTSCYDQFRTDYAHSTVAFSTASGDANDSGILSRTVVKGEGLELDIGVYLAGVLENQKERWVEYELDPTLLDGTSYEMMPDDYYTLSNTSKFIIPSGKQIGRVNVKLDSAKFVNDRNAVKEHYAIPFRLTGTSADSVLQTQSTKILVVKYINQYQGFYNQSGSFDTYDSNGNKINSGDFTNLIKASTVMGDTLRTDGLINQRGEAFMLSIVTEQDNTVSLGYIPDPTPPQIENIAKKSDVSTSYVSGWECLECVKDGAQPQSSNDRSNGVYGNWPEGSSWQWIEYDFPNYFKVSSTDVYWFTDGGGLQAPQESYVSYVPADGDQFQQLPNSELGYAYDQFNTLAFSPELTTNQIRINFRRTDGNSVGVIEWQVWGLPAPVSPEQAAIASVVPLSGEENVYDPATYTYTLNYRVNFENGGYSIVNTKMVWRNRVRDGVNEWRR